MGNYNVYYCTATCVIEMVDAILLHLNGMDKIRTRKVCILNKKKFHQTGPSVSIFIIFSGGTKIVRKNYNCEV